MNSREAEVFKNHGCTVITATDALLAARGKLTLDQVFDRLQDAAGKAGVECLRTYGLGHQPYEDMLCYGRVLKDGDWTAALQELGYIP